MRGLAFTGLIWLPILIGLWIGVIGLAKAGRGGSWWAMLSGVVLLSLGMVIGLVGSILLAQRVAIAAGPSSGSSFAWGELIAVGGVISFGLGTLLFAIGFSIHGFKARRFQGRITELEMVIQAQNEQLGRIEGGSEG